MSQAFIDELKAENLCAHFILPFLKLSKFSFTSSGYINTFITQDRQRVAVQITDTVFLSRSILVHPEFSAIYKTHDNYYLVTFRIRSRWQNDLDLFCEGKYSHLSAKAKEYIIRYSKLPYHKKEGEKVVTDGRLLALEKHISLRGMWEKELFEVTGKSQDDPDLHLPEEYLSLPGESTFINQVGLTRVRETQL